MHSSFKGGKEVADTSILITDTLIRMYVVCVCSLFVYVQQRQILISRVAVAVDCRSISISSGIFLSARMQVQLRLQQRKSRKLGSYYRTV